MRSPAFCVTIKLNQLAYAHQRTFSSRPELRFTWANPFPQANRVARYFNSVAKNMTSPVSNPRRFSRGRPLRARCILIGIPLPAIPNE
jgi:hypothetical protein